VVVGRWIAASPKIFILDGPTVGIDVGSKNDVHNIIGDLANKGIGITHFPH
jgi:simple sugar transport system ATP-binding protein